MKISIVIPTYNESENIIEISKDIEKIFSKLKYDYEQIIIDNSSTDGTIQIIKNLAKENKNIKVIINSRNYGHIRSPFYGILQSSGDATIFMAADYQDPPELIYEYIKLWEQGKKVILAKKKSSNENRFIFNIRKIFYRILDKISDHKLTIDTTGAGLYDKSIISHLNNIRDPYPYFRGLISELTNEISFVEFAQPLRKYGITKNNFFSLYDLGMLGIVKNSRAPLRFMTLVGFISSIISLFIGIFYFFYKLFFWETFSLGLAPVIIGIFFISSIQIVLLGLMGEYIGVILLHQRNMPLVIEKERINFDN